MTASRWIEILLVQDALTAGASYRDIAACFFGDAADVPRWRVAAAKRRRQLKRARPAFAGKSSRLMANLYMFRSIGLILSPAHFEPCRIFGVGRRGAAIASPCGWV